MSAEPADHTASQISDAESSASKYDASNALEAEGSRSNTASSNLDTCSSTTSEGRESAQSPSSLMNPSLQGACGDPEIRDQELETPKSSGDDVLLEEEIRSISDNTEAEAYSQSPEDDGSCSEGALECVSRDIGLGENPFTSPSRAVGAVQHSTASPLPNDMQSSDMPTQRFFQDSRLQDPLAGAQMIEQQVFQGSPNPAQLHRRPYTPEKYSPEQQDRRRSHPSGATQRDLQSEWSARDEVLWDSRLQDADGHTWRRHSWKHATNSQPGTARQTFDSPRSYAPFPANGYGAQQAPWQGGAAGPPYNWQPDHLMYPDSRPRQGFYEGYGGFGRQGMGPYGAPSHQGDSAGYQVHSSFTASLSERSGQQQQQGFLAHPPHPHAGLASGWPMHEAGSANAEQSWDGAETSEAHKLLQELADAQAAERDYLGTIKSLSARLEAAMGREATLRQRLFKAEAAASTLDTRQPSAVVESPGVPLAPASEISTEAPGQAQNIVKMPGEKNETMAEPLPAPEEAEAPQQKLESPAEQSAGKDAALERERAETAALQISLDAANETCRNLQRELAFANKRLENTATEGRQADAQLARMRAANAELESSLERARAEISQMMDQLRDDARALKAAERQRQEAEFQAVSLRQALDAAKRSVATREQDFVRLQQNLHTARAELADLQSRYRQLERSSLMSQPVVLPAGVRTASHDGASPLPTSRQEGTPRQTRPPSPRSSNASLPSSIETATRGFTRGPPATLVFHPDPMPKLAALHNGHHCVSSPELPNGRPNTDAASTAALMYDPDQRQPGPLRPESALYNDRHARSPEPPPSHSEDHRSLMSDSQDKPHWHWEAGGRQIRHAAAAQLQIGAFDSQALFAERPAAGLASDHSGARERAAEQQQAQQQRYRAEQAWADAADPPAYGAESAADASPSWGSNDENESRRGSVAQGSGVRDSSSVHSDDAGYVLQNGARNAALALRQEQYDDSGTESGAFRPYATDLSLQDFMRREKVLEDRLLVLNEEDKRLEAEYARMPAVSAGRTLAERRRRAEVEATLEANKREGSNLRLQLKRLGVK